MNKFFIITATYHEGGHDHTYRGLMSGESLEEVEFLAPTRAVEALGFFSGDEDCRDDEYREEAAAIDVDSIDEISATDAAVILRINALHNWSEE